MPLSAQVDPATLGPSMFDICVHLWKLESHPHGTSLFSGCSG